MRKLRFNILGLALYITALAVAYDYIYQNDLPNVIKNDFFRVYEKNGEYDLWYYDAELLMDDIMMKYLDVFFDAPFDLIYSPLVGTISTAIIRAKVEGYRAALTFMMEALPE